MSSDQLVQRGQSRNTGTDMIRQTGDVEVDALAGIALALPVGLNGFAESAARSGSRLW